MPAPTFYRCWASSVQSHARNGARKSRVVKRTSAQTMLGNFVIVLYGEFFFMQYKRVCLYLTISFSPRGPRKYVLVVVVVELTRPLFVEV